MACGGSAIGTPTTIEPTVSTTLPAAIDENDPLVARSRFEQRLEQIVSGLPEILRTDVYEFDPVSCILSEEIEDRLADAESADSVARACNDMHLEQRFTGEVTYDIRSDTSIVSPFRATSSHPFLSDSWYPDTELRDELREYRLVVSYSYTDGEWVMQAIEIEVDGLLKPAPEWAYNAFAFVDSLPSD